MEREITITVNDEQAQRIEERVAAGEYSSAADYVQAAVDNFVLFASNGPPLSDELLRQLIQEADDDPRADVDADEAFERVYRYIDELAAKLDVKS
jgi:Arc/MetJ-type ribon-helix-helix transcriptional regulator